MLPGNFRWVTDQIAASSIPLAPQQISALKQSGIASVIALLSKNELEDLELSLYKYRRALQQKGIRLYYLPVPNGKKPSIQQFHAFRKIVRKAERTHKKIAVHCLAGNGRTGTLLAGYLITDKGYYYEDAVRRVQVRFPRKALPFPENQIQENFLRKLESHAIGPRRLSSKRRPEIYAWRQRQPYPINFRVPTRAQLLDWQKRIRRKKNKKLQKNDTQPKSLSSRRNRHIANPYR